MLQTGSRTHFSQPDSIRNEATSLQTVYQGAWLLSDLYLDQFPKAKAGTWTMVHGVTSPAPQRTTRIPSIDQERNGGLSQG